MTPHTTSFRSLLADVSPLHPTTPRQQADRGVVLAAVRRSGEALKHAAGSLRADKEVVLAASRASSAAFR